jgi:uncharacterized protein involved in type VI secretion and phage assembly
MAETGVAVAIVVDNTDDSGSGRIRVRYPWQSQPAETYWARVATPMAGANRGCYFMPEKGDEVLVAFERGDLRSPYVIGSLWNAEAPPPATNKDGRNDLRLIRTRKGHLLKFDDGAKSSVRLELNDGKHLAIDDNAITVEDRNGNGITIQSATGALTIRSSGQLTLKASQISIESSGTIAVKATATLTLQGSLVNIN